MLKTRIQKIEAMFELLYDEIKAKNNEIIKFEIMTEKTQEITVNKDDFIELIKDMEISLRISTECIEKGEIIADRYPEGYFSTKRYFDKKKEKEEAIEQAKQRKKDNEK